MPTYPTDSLSQATAGPDETLCIIEALGFAMTPMPICRGRFSKPPPRDMLPSMTLAHGPLPLIAAFLLEQVRELRVWTCTFTAPRPGNSTSTSPAAAPVVPGATERSLQSLQSGTVTAAAHSSPASVALQVAFPF
jgi:hypothetical protein